MIIVKIFSDDEHITEHWAKRIKPYSGGHLTYTYETSAGVEIKHQYQDGPNALVRKLMEVVQDNDI